MEMETFKFKLPAAVQISGPSNVGKSVFVSKVLKFRQQLIVPPPEIIFYCGSMDQPKLYEQLQKDCGNSIVFLHGLSDLEKIKFDPSVAHVIVLDDLMYEVGNSEFASNLFTKFTHHGNILLIFVTQNIYFKSKFMPTINRNIKYNVVFRNKRFRHELETLARQSLGISPKHIHTIMEMAAVDNTHPYIVLDLQNDTPEHLAIVTNIFPDSMHPQAYFYVET